MGTASASGENASIEAARQAISSPLMEEGGVKGARGVLINITGSSRLSLHDVNEACSLIRAATANEDAQINFGVVLNESMKDEVKITVIATGFQRDNLPQLARRVTVGGTESLMPEPAFPPPVPIMEPAMTTGPLFRDMPPPPPALVVEEPPPVPVDDLEVPAFMRRERRLYQ
jgi:cell division protein FtsZ